MWAKALMFFWIFSQICWVARSQEKVNSDTVKTEKKEKLKLVHAEPLYVDLIRDLGARKGEKEWNLGFGVADHANFVFYNALVEYEFAPVNRLGFEVEVPLTFAHAKKGHIGTVPKLHWEGIKLATQFTFLVNEKYQTSMAIGYIQEFEFPEFADWSDKPLVNGTIYNPFFVAAKRWGRNFHSLIYTGPMLLHDFEKKKLVVDYEFNASVHYMFTGTHNFVGVEMDSQHAFHEHHYILRPQFKLKVMERTNAGFVFSIPTNRKEEGFGGFIRIIYEPK